MTSIRQVGGAAVLLAACAACRTVPPVTEVPAVSSELCPTGQFRTGGSGPCTPDGSWVTIRAGSYLIGAPEDEVVWDPDQTRHEVTLTHDSAFLATCCINGFCRPIPTGL